MARTNALRNPLISTIGLVAALLATSIYATPLLETRQSDVATDFCRRWSHQSAVVNGTLYVFGGRKITAAGQTTDEWNNDFLSYDLTKTWQISSPTITGLPQPSGPPPVANGALWASYDSLFLYGGEFSDSPATSPSPMAMREYSVGSSSWSGHDSPETSSGTNAPSDNVPVYRAAEGAGFSMASLGRGWYFGGHEDGYTVEGWSQSVPRIYLTSLLEFTFPGYSNDEVNTLSGGSVAPADGIWRNVTQGAISSGSGFPERADGVLVYIPGFGNEGLLLGLAGGLTVDVTSNTFTQLNIVDVYDIATSTWYKQATAGPTPDPRVNPCAVVAAAADGSSYQVYMFGGQNLTPAGEQTQYSDMWILSVPSFTWLKVDTSDQSTPPGRSGHTCNIWDGQMVVVGGYVSDITCDFPGVYVFNTSSLEWVSQYTATSNNQKNPQSQQSSQVGKAGGLQGSYGYEVPDTVQSAIGGGPSGGADVTSPSATATSGPLASGSPLSYPVTGGKTGSGGSDDTSNGSSSGGSGSSSNSSSGSSSDHVGAIVAGVVAGVFGVIAIYLGFVTYIYRKRMQQYKRNVERFGWTPTEKGSSNETSRGRSREGYSPVANNMQRRSSSADLLGNREPTFVGIMLHPRRSLRVTNPDVRNPD